MLKNIFRGIGKQIFKEVDRFGRILPSKQGEYYLPSITVDALVFRDKPDGLHDILLITRKKDPFKGLLAFPGGFVDYNEDPVDACLRELKEECSIDGKDPVLITVEGDPLRDPRGHTITIAYKVSVPFDARVKAADDALSAEFYPVKSIIKGDYLLAFDHLKILRKALLDMNLNEKYSNKMI